MRQIKKQLPLLYGIYVLIWWAISSWQFLHFYYTYGVFDLSIFEFLVFMVPLFLPLVTFGASIVSYYIKRFRLALWMRKNLAISEFSTTMTPSQAGLVLDYRYGNIELIATLLDLHFKGVVTMEVGAEGAVKLTKLKDLTENAPGYERVLIASIFEDGDSRTYPTVNDPFLRKSGRAAHKELMSWADQNDTLMEIIPKQLKRIAPVIVLLSLFGFVVSLATVFVLIADYESATTLGDVTYPVYPVQLLIVHAITAWALLLLGSSYWPRFSNNHRSAPVRAWVEVYGLRYFLKTVYRDRFSPEHIATQTKSEVAQYVPYLVAFDLVPCTPQYLRSVLLIKDA